VCGVKYIADTYGEL